MAVENMSKEKARLNNNRVIEYDKMTENLTSDNPYLIYYEYSFVGAGKRCDNNGEPVEDQKLYGFWRAK